MAIDDALTVEEHLASWKDPGVHVRDEAEPAGDSGPGILRCTAVVLTQPCLQSLREPKSQVIAQTLNVGVRGWWIECLGAGGGVLLQPPDNPDPRRPDTIRMRHGVSLPDSGRHAIAAPTLQRALVFEHHRHGCASVCRERHREQTTASWD